MAARVEVVPLATEDVLERLERVRRSGDDRWMAVCPAHGDNGPSLSIRKADDGRILLHDFGGCSVGEVCAAIGIEVRQLFPSRDTPWRPTRPRLDSDRAARELFQRLQRLHRPVTAERYRRELTFVGRVLAGGTGALAEVADFNPVKLQVWSLRVLLQAAHELARQGTPRRWFGLVALAAEIDRWNRPGYSRRRGVLHLARLAVRIAHQHQRHAFEARHAAA